MLQSKNFFAALDDSDNEGGPVAVPVKKKEQPKKPAAKPATGDATKTDPRYVHIFTSSSLIGGLRKCT
jgi:hypothetical protein